MDPRARLDALKERKITAHARYRSTFPMQSSRYADYAVAVPFRSGAAYLRKTLPRNRESLPAYRKEVYTHSVAST